MPLTNSETRYGAIAKLFHWLIALFILSSIPLGLIATDMAHALEDPNIPSTQADIDRTVLLFSIHKTLGVAIFFTALARILWALAQPKPKLLNGDKPLEAYAASTVHWLLYGSLVAVPLSGWVHHAATTGFAPIWWPFGQSLPFVPKVTHVAELASTVHYLLQWVLIGALVLHVAGALKHHVIDKDATLRRMLPGGTEAQPTARQPGHALPFLSALAVWAVVLGGAGAAGWFEARAGMAPTLEQAESEWQVQDGTLNISVTQMGSTVEGSFADWTANIAYSQTPDANGKHGEVEVTVAIPSLTLGSVTDQAMGPDFFNAENHPTATFTADILAENGDHIALGTLSIKGSTVPVEMPFSLSIDDGTAAAEGSLSVDRRDFQIGMGTDEGSLAFAVDISFALTAMRSE
jgi:cytochrome b561/polyisoprenoid-binding protein YceI